MTEPTVPDEADVQDVLTFLGASPPADDATVLEVHQLWGNLIVDTRQFEPDRSSVRVGEATSTRWWFLGVDMGVVPAGLRPFLAAGAPMWSDFDTVGTFDFRVPEVEEGLVLFRRDPELGCVATVPDGWQAVADTDGLGVAVTGDVALAVVDRLVLTHGEHRFVARRVPRAGRLDRSPLAPDPWAIGLLGAVATLFFAVVLLSRLAAPVRTVAEVEADEPLRAMLLEVPAPRTTQAPSSAADTKRGSVERSDPRTPRFRGTKIRTPSKAQGAGLLSTNLDALLGGDLPSDLVAGVGNLIGGRATGFGGGGFPGGGGCPGGACGGEAEGHDGSGLRGTGPRGPVGGGPSWSKEDRGPGVTPTGPIVIGALDRSLIDEVVKNHTAVSSASVKSSTMGSDAVESCLVSRFLKMRFPEPRGGGIVVVSYPFLFAPN